MHFQEWLITILQSYQCCECVQFIFKTQNYHKEVKHCKNARNFRCKFVSTLWEKNSICNI